jgi:hypothetical protein
MVRVVVRFGRLCEVADAACVREVGWAQGNDGGSFARRSEITKLKAKEATVEKDDVRRASSPRQADPHTG